MAKFGINNTTHGLSGKVDQFVYKQWFGQTLAAKLPRKPSTASGIQTGIRSMFKEAAKYAKAAITDPVKKALYKKHASPGQTAYNLAIADFFRPPEIGEIDATGYTGQIRSTISIEAADDTKVVKVEVRINNADGSLAEQGEAVLQTDGLHWLYTSTTVNAALAGDSITVTAYDLPGNPTVKQKIL